MLEMALNSAKLFMVGKLFQDNKKVMRQLLMAVLLGVVVLIAVAQFAPVWVAAAVAGGASGFAQPILFKDLKYA
ncbi:MAG: hypothetical protein AAF727_15010 [Pseudomonadota bacterium]